MKKKQLQRCKLKKKKKDPIPAASIKEKSEIQKEAPEMRRSLTTLAGEFYGPG